MNKKEINRKNTINRNKFKLTISFAWFIFAYAIIVIGSTYAYQTFTASSANAASGTGGCFKVSYTGQEINAGDILSTTNYLEGPHTTVTLSKDSTCKIYTEANIYLHTNDTTTAPLETEPALKYKIFEQSTNNQVGGGIINSKGDYILATVPITDTTTTYTIYVWVDSDLSDGKYHNTLYSGYIYAESAQTSTIENQYLVSFNTNGPAKYTQQSVTSGGTYSGLPTPTKEGYTFGGWSLVPNEYQQVEYIESSGTQYINTEVIPTNTTGIYARLASKNISSDLLYFGSKGTDNSRFWIGNTSSQEYFGWNTVLSPRTTISLETIYTYKMNYLNDRKTSINDTVKNTNIGTLLTSNTYPIFIFAGNTAGTANYKSSIKLYNFTVSYGATIIRNFIPCYKKTDPEHPGLFDTVTGEFYGNSGTGSFTAGAAQTINNGTTVTQQGNHKLYAIWTPKTYTLTLNANGGSVSPTSMQVTYNTPYGTLPTPTRSGYTFKGWNGKNLLNYNNLSQSAQSVNIYVDNNGYITDSTPTSDSRGWGYAQSNWQLSLAAGTYTLSLLFSQSTSNSNCNLVIYNANNESIKSAPLLNKNRVEVTFTLSTATSVGIMPKGYEGLYKIQLQAGSTATAWEPFYIKGDTKITQGTNHTLKAIWE